MSKKLRNQILAVGMSAAMAGTAMPVTAFAVTKDETAKDGEYVAAVTVPANEEDEWEGYDATVKLTVKDGKFEQIDVTPAKELGESESYFKRAVSANTKTRKGIQTVLTGLDATENSIQSWDTVSGATYTSQAIKDAALDAIRQAPSNQAEEPAEEPKSEEPKTEEPAAEEPKSEERYVLMNIPYAEFYASEVQNDVPVDAVTSATLNKTRTHSMVAGSYHQDPAGTDISGVVYPVKLSSNVDLSAFSQVTDESSVDVSVTNRGKTSTTTLSGKDALFEKESYAYYVLSEAPAYYKEAFVENGALHFGKAQGNVTEVSGVTASFTTNTTYGDYQLNLDGVNFDTDTLNGIVISTTDGSSYGLRHMENIWFGTQLSWSTGFTTQTHGCPLSFAHYESMMGKTIDKLTYYTAEGIYSIDIEDVYVPKKCDASVEVKADRTGIADGMEIAELKNLPEDFAPSYQIEGVDAKFTTEPDGRVVIDYSKEAVKAGSYRLTVKDANGRYAELHTDFVVYAKTNPAAFDAAQTALVKADGADEADFKHYLGNITEVKINDKAYRSTGRGSVQIINPENGSLDLTKADAADSYAISVAATGYPELKFEIKKEQAAEYRYVYAPLTWEQFWEAEGVMAADSTESVDEADAHGEKDKGAFDTVSRATTNHGLHRGSFQSIVTIYAENGKSYAVSHWSDDGKTMYLTDGSAVSYNRGTMTLADGSTTKLASYEVSGMKYIPVKVKSEDYEAFKAAYPVVEAGGKLIGGFGEMELSSYENAAEVTENTNGLKLAVKQADGSFRFEKRTVGNDSGILNAPQKKAADVTTTVKDASGSYGEFLRVDLNGNYGDLASAMYAVKWTYYGNDSSYQKELASYGTKFAADNWMHKKMGIQLGLTESKRCMLPEGTDGTGYWALTVYAMGYEDYTTRFTVEDKHIVKPEAEKADLTKLQAAVAQAEKIAQDDYTKASFDAMTLELQEAKDILKKEDATQAEADEAAAHLEAAVKALEKKPTPTAEPTKKPTPTVEPTKKPTPTAEPTKKPSKVNTTELRALIEQVQSLNRDAYTADSYKVVATALKQAEAAVKAMTSQTAVDRAQKELNTALLALKANKKNEQAMYRLYNPNSGEHFYTASVNERNNVIKAGWKYEGIGWYAPKTSKKPVYRLYNPNAGDHHYTVSKAERNMLLKAGWKDEGIGWYAAEKGVAVYRQYNPNAVAGAHNFTTNKNEDKALVKAGWKAEGIAWYALK